MLYLAICDDDTSELEIETRELEAFIQEKQIEAQVDTFRTVKELYSFLEEAYRPDLIFLDIELGDENGIATGKRINQLYPRCKIAFVTNYIAYAMDASEVDHCYYVLKSEFKERMERLSLITSMQNVNSVQAEKNVVFLVRGEENHWKKTNCAGRFR